MHSAATRWHHLFVSRASPLIGICIGICAGTVYKCEVTAAEVYIKYSLSCCGNVDQQEQEAACRHPSLVLPTYPLITKMCAVDKKKFKKSLNKRNLRMTVGLFHFQMYPLFSLAVLHGYSLPLSSASLVLSLPAIVPLILLCFPLSPPLLPSSLAPQLQTVPCRDLMKQGWSNNGNFCRLPHELWCTALCPQRIMILTYRPPLNMPGLSIGPFSKQEGWIMAEYKKIGPFSRGNMKGEKREGAALHSVH